MPGVLDSRWSQVKQVLTTLAEETSRLGFESFSEADHLKRRDVPSPVPGFRIEMETSALLNGMWVVSIEAERAYLFGLLYRSMVTNVMIGPNGAEFANQFAFRTETAARRRTRRNWLRARAEKAR